MDEHIKAYFQPCSGDSPAGHFRQVIKLHESPDLAWQDVQKLVPNMPKGWFELAHLSVKDRIEFTRDFWLMKLPFHPLSTAFFSDFFSSLRDIGIYITQQRFDDPYEVHMVYGLNEDRGFFRGCPPATEEGINRLRSQFGEVVLPVDFMAFLEIHDAFSKYTDTGIACSSRLHQKCVDFQTHLEALDPLLTPDGSVVDPKKLIPFYESFGFPCYQCFWGEWYPDQEMGNIYYSGLTHTISDYRTDGASPENMSFPTFIDWLMFYLETFKI